jgi:nuclear pore complex protein Nup133
MAIGQETILDTLMKSSGTDIRTFLRSEVVNLDALIPALVKMFENTRNKSLEHLLEINDVIISIYGTAMEYVDKNLEIYGISKSVWSDSWTCAPEMIEALQRMLDISISAVRSYRSSHDSNNMDTDDFDPKEKLKEQVVRIADYVLNAYHERMNIPNIVDMGDSKKLRDAYSAYQPKIIQELVFLGKLDAAFHLCEKYRDFATLVDLTLKDTDKKKRIDDYVSRFQNDFSFVLFRHYLEKGMQKELLTQPDEYNGLVESFLSDVKYPLLSFLHHVRMHRFGDANKNADAFYESENVISKKELALALGKLSYLATNETQQMSVVSRMNGMFLSWMD